MEPGIPAEFEGACDVITNLAKKRELGISEYA